MKRLIAFGCSHTYGMGLEDSFIEEEPFKPYISPSKYAWPNLLAEQLDRECVNLSIPGGSNLEILYSILDFKFQKSDSVVVGWTSPLRDIVVYPESTVRIAPFLVNGMFAEDQVKEIVPNLYPGSNSVELQEINKKYFQVHSDTDMNIRSWLHQYTAGCYLKSKNIDFHFSSVWGWKPTHIKIESFITLENFLEHLGDCNQLDFARDKMHMGPNAHQLFAAEVLKSFIKTDLN